METRAHHVLIGAFTLIVVAAALLFALWLTKSSISRQYSYYDIVFTEAVTGLSQGGVVQYNGIKVGDVAKLRLDPDDPRKVLVRIRVAGDTPIKDDTRAKLGLTGLTGVAFIQLTGGTPGSPPLTAPRGQIPRIQADDSALQKLLAGSENIVTNVNDIITRASELMSKDNVEHITRTLENLDQVTSSVAGERDDLRVLIQQLTVASKQMNETLAQTSQLSRNANTLLADQGQATLDSATAAMKSIQDLSQRLDKLLGSNSAAISSGAQGLSELGPAIRELHRTLQSLSVITAKLEANPRGFLLGGDHPQEFQPK